MAINWRWLVGGAFGAVLAAVVWWPEAVVTTELECPEGGCQVGYRFEDGGISPEGWEPFETDDPVVALMDACLTYFMTGEPGDDQISIRDEGENGIFLSLADLDDTVRIINHPFQGPWGTFSCDNRIEYAMASHPEILEWLSFRFEEPLGWQSSQERGELFFDQRWGRDFRSNLFDADVRVENRQMPGASGVVLNSGTTMSIRFKLRVDYRGPYFEYVGAVPEIVF